MTWDRIENPEKLNRNGCPICAQPDGKHSKGCYHRRGMETPERAMRHNEGKPKMSYMTDFPVAMEGLARVMMLGEHKYERDNWKLGITINEYLDSFLRHATDFKRGITYDKESGIHQFFHMAVNAMMLAEIHGESAPTVVGVDMASEDDQTVYAVFKKEGWTRVEDGRLLTEEEVAAMKRANREEGRMMSDDESDAALYAMMAADIIIDARTKREGQEEKMTMGREGMTEGGGGGSDSTAEDGPLLDSTGKPVSETGEGIARMGSGIGIHPMELVNEYFRMGFMNDHDRGLCRQWLHDNQGDYLYCMEKLDPLVMPDGITTPQQESAAVTTDRCFAVINVIEDKVDCVVCNFHSNSLANLPCECTAAKD